MIVVTKQQIKDILGNRENMLKAIDIKMNYYRKELQRLETVLQESTAYSHYKEPEIPRIKSSSNMEVTDTILKCRKQLLSSQIEFEHMVWHITEQQEAINRVWAAFLLLNEPYFSTLESLYVKKEKYACVEAASLVSHRTFEKRRETGIQRILDLYESSLTPEEMIQREETIKIVQGMKEYEI